jgi:hypothetical protein
MENNKVKKSLLKQAAATAIAAAFAAPAFGANIVLIDSTNSFATAPHGAEALFAFQKAANYWNKTLSNNVTIRIDIGFEGLGAGILGSTGSNASDIKVGSVYNALAATGTSALDSIAVANLSKLDANGNLSMRVNGYVDPIAQTGIDTAAASRLSSGNSVMNRYLYANTSVLKALNLSTGQPANASDASITFSSSFGFDFNPTDGISAGKYDFTAVAVHELGHALGFVSGVDAFDYYGHPGGPGAVFLDGDHVDNYSIGSTLDLFRYGNGFNADGTRQLQWAAGRDAFFSIDGQTVFNIASATQQAGFFSTGEYNGDGHQASHWADNKAALLPNGCYQSTKSIGIMDPTAAACDLGVVTQNDLAAFDAMGWNLNQNILAAPGYAVDTKQIFEMEGTAVTAVPEPETYAMLLAGLGLTGFLARRRKAKAA